MEIIQVSTSDLRLMVVSMLVLGAAIGSLLTHAITYRSSEHVYTIYPRD